MVQSQKPAKTSRPEAVAQTASDHQQTKASAAYDVELSQAAESAYEGFYRRAAEARDRGEMTSSHFTVLNMLEEVIEKTIPQDPFNKKYALQGGLSGIFRIKRGRLSICWMGLSNHRKIYVVFISETLRKEGDHPNDPYRLITSMMMSGQYEEFFEALGLPPASLNSGPGRGYLAN